jgi:hypothetical protein
MVDLSPFINQYTCILLFLSIGHILGFSDHTLHTSSFILPAHLHLPHFHLTLFQQLYDRQIDHNSYSGTNYTVETRFKFQSIRLLPSLRVLFHLQLVTTGALVASNLRDSGGTCTREYKKIYTHTKLFQHRIRLTSPLETFPPPLFSHSYPACLK